MAKIYEVTEGIVGKEQLSRALNVLGLLGGELPEQFGMQDGVIVLNNQDENTRNQMSFGSNTIRITLGRDKYKYSWSRNIGDDIIEEQLYSHYYDLNAVFSQEKKATTTSVFYLTSQCWGSPKITCDIFNVTNGSGDDSNVPPVSEYYNVIFAYLKGLVKSNDINPVIIGTIIKVFEDPIKKHVFDLMNNDQSWRFDYENSKIVSDYKKGVKSSLERFLKVIKEAHMAFALGVESASAYKDRQLELLKKLEMDYSERRVAK